MAIGLNCLIEANNIKTNSVFDTVIEDVSYTSSMLNYLTEMNYNYRVADKEFYKSVYESTTLTAVNEAFIDFFTKIKDIIKSFLKYIKSLFDRFITVLHRMVGSEKYILKNEETLKKFNTEHEFEFDGYTFTIEPNIPVCNALIDFSDSLIELNFKDLQNAKAKDKAGTIKAMNKKLKEKLDNEYYDEIRSKVLGRNEGYIYESDYNNELFEIFRDNSDSTSVFTVTSGIVIESLTNFKSYKKTEKDIKEKKKDIEDQYNAISKKIDRMIESTKSGGLYKVQFDSEINNGDSELQLNNEAMNQLNLYVKTLSDQITKMSTIHGTAFSYKLDALKDQYAQDKRILYIALSKIQKDKEFRKGEI